MKNCSTSCYNNLQVLVAFNNRSFPFRFSCTGLQGWPVSSRGSKCPQTEMVGTVMSLCLSWASNQLIWDLFHVSLVRTWRHKHTALREPGGPRSIAGLASPLRRSGSAACCWLEWSVRDEAGALPSFSSTNETRLSLWDINLPQGWEGFRFVFWWRLLACSLPTSIYSYSVGRSWNLIYFLFLKTMLPFGLFINWTPIWGFPVSRHTWQRHSVILFPEVSFVKTKCFIR